MENAENSAPSNESTFETFENFDEINEEQEDGNDDWSKPESETEKVSEDLKVLKDSQTDSEGKVLKKDKDSKKEEAEEEESEKEESEEEEEESEEEEQNEDLKKKKEEDRKGQKSIRITMDGEKYNIRPDTTIPVKIDGKLENVPVQDLINGYSGKVAYDKKFTELGKEKKGLEIERNTINSEKQELEGHIQKVVSSLNDKNKNPLEALMYLVEISGGDPYAVYRKSMEANLDELDSILDLGETERELYFLKKKDELHSYMNEKRTKSQTEEQNFNQVVSKVDSLRQAYNISEEDFVESSHELEDIFKASGFDLNEITNETIVDYASLRPHIADVKKLVGPYEDNISDDKYGDIVAELAKYVRDGKADLATVKQLLKQNFSVDDNVKELNTRVYNRESKTPSKNSMGKSSTKFESFDEWDD